ncbi:odorant receptor 10-like [Chironomus tepperi]|uniref:odorant receptor 10-like n=1 Tax=Chironomus tepperi TaxID=113505 RepID=UPI00391FC170
MFDLISNLRKEWKIFYVASYFHYVQCKIQYLNEELIAKKVKGNELKKRIAEIIEAHNIAIKFAEQLEDISNILVFVLYSVNTIILCFLFFEFNILSEDMLNFFKVLVFFGVVQMLLFLFSYFGTNLEDQSKLIEDLIYDLPWYEMEDQSDARSLILCILRAQRPCLITAAKFYPLNFESYLTAVKSAYSFCTVLKDII